MMSKEEIEERIQELHEHIGSDIGALDQDAHHELMILEERLWRLNNGNNN